MVWNLFLIQNRKLRVVYLYATAVIDGVPLPTASGNNNKNKNREKDRANSIYAAMDLVCL